MNDRQRQAVIEWVVDNLANTNTNWNLGEVLQLCEMRMANKTHEEISAVFGRSVGGCQKMWKNLRGIFGLGQYQHNPIEDETEEYKAVIEEKKTDGESPYKFAYECEVGKTYKLISKGRSSGGHITGSPDAKYRLEKVIDGRIRQYLFQSVRCKNNRLCFTKNERGWLFVEQ